jgi:putative nucleotidyltransferase with HDIG domain
MGKISTEHLKPGMTLGEDLIHPNGRLLLSQGTRLEANHLRIFKMWGVMAVEIEGESENGPPVPPEKIDPAVIQLAEKLTRNRFSRSNVEHPFLRKLLTHCSLRRAQQMILSPNSLGMGISAETDGEVVPLPSTSPVSTGPRKQLQAFIEDDIELASLPNIFIEISKVIGDSRSSVIHVADVISKDPGLSAKLLRIVNSAFYNFPSKVDTISRAVMIVGTKQLSTLALGTSVISIFHNIPAEMVDMKSFWQHSFACGIGARMISSFKNVANTERLFVAGLLHDIGRIILYKYFPSKGRDILLRAKQARCHLFTAESAVLGFDHGQIGGMLLKKWNLPLILENSVECHHNLLQSKFPLEASILHLADILTNALGIGTSGEYFVPPIQPEVWEELALPVEFFTNIIPLIDRQVQEAMHNFFDGQ